MKYQHLFFDLDHTLWDFDSNAKECLMQLYLEFDLRSKAIDSFDGFYYTYEAHNATLWKRFEKGYISGEELKWRRMWRTLLDYKIADEKLAREMSEVYMELLPKKNRVFDYTFEILDYLTEKGYQLNLLTNGFEESQRKKLASSHLEKYFNHIITSESSNSQKPKKEIFEYALNKAGGSVSDSMMLGDNVEADIAGALNVGMDCVFVNHAKKNVDCHPTYSIQHLKELESIL